METDADDRDPMDKIDVRVPASVLEKIDREYPRRGYSSRSEAIRDALRDWLNPSPELSEKTLDDLQVSREQREKEATVSGSEVREQVNAVDSVSQSKEKERETTIVVFAEGETALRAEKVADDVLDEDQLEELRGDDDAAKNLADDTDFFIAEKELMQDIGRYLGTILAPRGKMPEPLDPDDDVVEVINRIKNTVQIRSGERQTSHTRVGAGKPNIPDDEGESTPDSTQHQGGVDFDFEASNDELLDRLKDLKDDGDE